MYEAGRVYVWRNITEPEWSHLSGTETTVTGPGLTIRIKGSTTTIWPTDTFDPVYPKRTLFAMPGDLRPRDTPSGERMVLGMFLAREHA